ncbi:protein kinase domain-containing protein [Legionella clemsonensis]|uniref:Serine/threonine-protein kinase PknB n=1 Tax=Legionella clemsonensis TaxID=1867846 RepID=A0A222P667_9GAMM|nr:protein kinase [Legionella clemsonensis]ASQ47354.1 Serine/threonine-protein kinase PknB [Legionella clemsonensis]
MTKSVENKPKKVITVTNTSIKKSYDKIHTLGKGAWGKVVKARNSQTGTIKAIKVQKIEAHKPNSAELKDDIQREASVGIHLGYTEGLFFQPSKKRESLTKAIMVNEYCPGTNMDELIKEGKYSGQDFLVIMRGMFQEIYRLHQAGVIHGDVKPANFIVNTDFTVKAVDYGFSAIKGHGESVSRGTPLYSPLELFIGISINQTADIYSAGISILEGLHLVKKERLILANQETNIIRLRPIGDWEKGFAKAFPNLNSEQINTLLEIIKKMIKESPTQRLKPDEFSEMLETYDKEILKIPAVPSVVNNVAEMVNDLIVMLEDRIKVAKPLEKEAIEKALGMHEEYTAVHLKQPKTLYALKAKITQANEDTCQDFNFARQIMGDLRDIISERLPANKFTAPTINRIWDTLIRLINRFLPVKPWAHLSVEGSVRVAQEEVEKKIQHNFQS